MPKLNVVILAAGLGKRMHSALPKVLHRLAAKPLLEHVLDTARALSPQNICVVYGHGGETVRQTMADETLIWVQQVPQLGTGHALMQALPHLGTEGATLVLYGDVPLTSVATLQRLIGMAGGETGGVETLALLTVELGRRRDTAASCAMMQAGLLRLLKKRMPASPSGKSAKSIPASW